MAFCDFSLNKECITEACLHTTCHLKTLEVIEMRSREIIAAFCFVLRADELRKFVAFTDLVKCTFFCTCSENRELYTQLYRFTVTRKNFSKKSTEFSVEFRTKWKISWFELAAV